MNLDVILLYAGAGLAVFSLLMLIVVLCRCHIAAAKLDKQLDAEYGARIGL